MKLELNNINKIKSAAIDLNGLTVIAGTNDTGKSTVGKVLFSIAKSLTNSHSNPIEEKEKKIFGMLDRLYRRIHIASRMADKIEKEPNEESWQYIKETFFPPIIMKEILPVLYDEKGFSPELKKEFIFDYFHQKEQIINEVNLQEFRKKNILIQLKQIVAELNKGTDRKTFFTEEFETNIQSEFLGNICSTSSDKSRIVFHSDSGSVSIDLKKNEISKIHFEDDLYCMLEDITFVETPLYMQLMDVLGTAITYRELKEKQLTTSTRFNPVIPLHIKDLIDKLGLSRYTIERKNTELLQSINKVIGGYFEYDKKTRELNLVKKQKGKSLKVRPVNVASGIKTFGLFQILLEVDEINERKMLIIDEPENHLHPKWQIECARLLVLLVKSGIPVMISSHSPYFIQGIRYFANKESLEDLVNYYLAEEDEETGLSIINDVTDDLNRVFLKLAEPLNNIMNLD